MDNLRGKNFLFEIAKNSITPELISSVIGSIKTAPTEIEEDENPADSEVDFKFNENEYLDELYDYISSTYGQHYSLSKIQSTEFIMDAGHGEGFTIGNIIKYAQRYGRKGGKNRADLLKVCHYAIMMLYVHDKYNTEKE
jgi:hypothetical protein